MLKIYNSERNFACLYPEELVLISKKDIIYSCQYLNKLDKLVYCIIYYKTFGGFVAINQYGTHIYLKNEEILNVSIIDRDLFLEYPNLKKGYENLLLRVREEQKQFENKIKNKLYAYREEIAHLCRKSFMEGVNSKDPEKDFEAWINKIF